MSAVYRRELRSFLCSMTGAIFISLILLMTGIFSIAYNFISLDPSFESVISGISFIYLLAVPILTMRSFAEERNSKTDQLLYSLPITTTSVVMAKFLAMATVLAIPVLVMSVYPLILALYGEIAFASAYSSISAFYLLGCTLISIGMFISSLAESQIIAAVISVGASLLIFLMSGIASLIPPTAAASLTGLIIASVIIALIIYLITKNYLVSTIAGAVLVVALALLHIANSSVFEGMVGNIISQFALFKKVYIFLGGIFDLTGVVYFLSVTALFVFVTIQSVEKRRWS